MPKEMSQKQAAEASAGFRRGMSKGTGLEGIIDGISSMLAQYAEFLEPISNAIADMLSGGEEAKSPDSIKAAVERYMNLPEKKGESDQQVTQGTVLGGM